MRNFILLHWYNSPNYNINDVIKKSLQVYKDLSRKQLEILLQRLYDQFPKWKSSVDIYLKMYLLSIKVKNERNLLTHKRKKKEYLTLKYRGNPPLFTGT
jgi:hypothetical protein